MQAIYNFVFNGAVTPTDKVLMLTMFILLLDSVFGFIEDISNLGGK